MGGYVLFVRKNALQVLIPKYGLEGTVFLNNPDSKTSMFSYNEEEGTQSGGGVTFHVFDPVTVQLSIDRSNVQHMKLYLRLVKPKVEGFSVPSAENLPSAMDTDDKGDKIATQDKKTSQSGKPLQKKKKKKKKNGKTPQKKKKKKKKKS